MEPAPVKAKPQGRLLVSTQLDAKDELEEVISPGSAVQKEHGARGAARGVRSHPESCREHFAEAIQRDTMDL